MSSSRAPKKSADILATPGDVAAGEQKASNESRFDQIPPAATTIGIVLVAFFGSNGHPGATNNDRIHFLSN